MPVRTEGTFLSQGAPRVIVGGRFLASSRFIDVTRDGKRILLGAATGKCQYAADPAVKLDGKSKALTAPLHASQTRLIR